MQEMKDKNLKYLENKQHFDRSTSLSIITLTVKGLNSPMKTEIVRMDKNITCPLQATEVLRLRGQK